MSLVPAALIFLLILFSANGTVQKSAATGTQNTVVLESFDDVPNWDVEIPVNEERDYSVIYGYITRKYTRVPTADADLIAKSLVAYSKEVNLDPKFGAAVMARESGFNRNAISVTGAKGLGQIKEFNFKSLDIEDPFVITQNTRGTVHYLRQMLNGWKAEERKAHLALASYFKGYGAVTRSNKLVDTQTKSYVKDILTTYDGLLKRSRTVE